MKKLNVNKIVTILYILILAVTAIFFVFNNPKKLQIILLCFGTLILSYVVLLKTRIKMPSLIYISTVIFIFMSQYLGNAMELYFKIKHWDKILHFTSGLILGMLGYVVFLNLVPKEAREKMNAWCSVIFSFLFGSACAGIWEIYEFTVDHLLGLLCQNNSLVDTMSDIIAGTITALIIAIMLWVHQNKKKIKVISYMEKEIVDPNKK